MCCEICYEEVFDMCCDICKIKLCFVCLSLYFFDFLKLYLFVLIQIENDEYRMVCDQCFEWVFMMYCYFY